MAETFSVWRGTGEQVIKEALPAGALEPLRAQAWELVVDLDRRVALEQTLGEIDLFRKRVRGKLLCFLMANAGRRFAPDELFESVWGMEFDDEIDLGTVKTSVSRLRALIEPQTPEWRYVKKTQATYLGRSGEYYFNPQVRFLLIQPPGLVVG